MMTNRTEGNWYREEVPAEADAPFALSGLLDKGLVKMVEMDGEWCVQITELGVAAAQALAAGVDPDLDELPDLIYVGYETTTRPDGDWGVQISADGIAAMHAGDTTE